MRTNWKFVFVVAAMIMAIPAGAMPQSKASAPAKQAGKAGTSAPGKEAAAAPAGSASADGSKPEETSDTAYRFRESVEPKATVKFTVHESRPLETRFQLTNLTDDQITVFLQQKSISPEIEAAFRKIVEQKNKIAGLVAEVNRRDEEKEKIYDDQERLRENLKALKGSAEERALTQRYTQQLADQETRLEAIERESADFQAKSDQAQANLDTMIENLALDATL